MPRVVNLNGYDVQVYTRDDQPSPVLLHIETAATVHKIILRDDEFEYHSYKGQMPTRQQKREAAQIVADHIDACRAVWRQYNEGGET
jgi:hypothetical protein